MKRFEKIFSALDLIDEIIYIADMDTYELVYCNQTTKNATGQNFDEEGVRYKCYECLQGLDHPCVFCNNDELKKSRRCIWSRQHPQNEKYYLLHDSVITVDGKDYRMELAVDTTHMEEAAVHTRHMLEMETHLTNCIRQLVKSGDFSNSVSVVLQTVLNIYGGDRAYLFDFDWEHNVTNNTYEICAPGITAEIDNLQNVPLEKMKTWLKYFDKRESLIIEDMEALKDDPQRQDEYHDLGQQGIHSIITVPLVTDNRLIGFVGVDNPKFHFANAEFLMNLAYFMGVEIDKNHVVQELQDISFHDSLTGAFNRQGFEKIMSNLTEEDQPIGFMVVDVDNFKMINDTFGHNVGDEILKEVANMLTSMFHSDDVVFRLGGDEFAMLLKNCNPDGWRKICSKIQWIHSALASKYDSMAVTLSAGVCIAADTYKEKVYQLADEAMYETKRNGRAGCTVINERTGERQYWNDDMSFHIGNVLEFNNTGLFRIEYPLDEKKAPSIICNELVKEMFAFPDNAGPEKCYQLWREGIEPSYFNALDRARQVLLDGGQAECTYQWNHPKQGKIFIRTSGTGEVVDGVQMLYGYHHSLRDTKIIKREDENKILLDAISSIYFGSYYINLTNDTYFAIKNAPNERFLQVQESNAAASLENYVDGLVRKEEHDKMMIFVNLQTLRDRLKNERHLDCEYVSVAEKSWCRATFIPVKYDDRGELTHVLFVVTPLDVNKAHELDKNMQNKKTVESLYNHVPGGLVMYEWNGKQLKTVQMSKYYEEQYGETLLSKEGTNVGGPDFRCIHPDDLEEYQKAIMKGLTETYHLEHVFRRWNNTLQRYVWVKINAVAEQQSDGTALVYAMYTDVTGQKEAELRLRKKQASLVAALSASNQLCYEYDPLTHVEECLTDDNVFHLPRIIENYPESMLPIVHEDDKETFLETIHSMDEGKEEASCNIRLLRDGKYVWYSYQMQSFYDSQKERIVVILSIIDSTEHVTTLQNYKARMEMLMSVTEEALSFATMNVTANTFNVVNAQKRMRELTDRAHTLQDIFNGTVQNVIGEKQQEEYRKTFSRENLLRLMERGQTHVHMEHLYRVSPAHIEWVSTCVDMLKNPTTGDVEGACYSKSVQQEKITNLLLDRTLQRDYPLVAVVYPDSGEYYLFNAVKGDYCIHRQNFWMNIADNLENIVEKDVISQVQQTLTKEIVLDKLKKTKEFSYTFDSKMNGRKSRLETRFNYLDENQEMMMATLRDITDSIIMERLRHDNERDHLTNLYNRRKTFAVCKKLLEEHPEDQFAMLHFDIKHFRLYNTFFGDVAGDKLLCDIADMFRNMDPDYDYWTYGRIESDVFCVFFPINQNKYQKHLHDLLHGLQDYRVDFLIEPAIGIYTVLDRDMPIESMFTRASMAAKTVKSGVTNSIVFYNEDMEQEMLDEQQVVNEMQAAIELEQFHVYLQPKYSLRTNKPVGAEALVRWIHPLKGLVSPAKFIPVFERNGFIATLDRYMWEHVCQLLKKWQDAGYELAPVSVNVSRISMYSQTTVQFLKELVTKYQIDPKYLELELTESAYMDDPMEMKKQLKQLQEFGFRILMDDFGSGYSSLNTLRELPVDCLKLDMKFLSESTTDERGRLVLASVVRMSRLLQLTIIAEGVETPEQADFLRALGCEYVQGYLYARPMPISSYEQILTAIERPVLLNKNAVSEHGREMLAAIDAQSQVIEDVFPAPVALVEYENKSFAYLRVNAIFLTEFGMEQGLQPMIKVFHEHLSDEDYERMEQAYEECADTKKNTHFRMMWHVDDNESREYACRVAYEGAVGNAAMMVVAFMNI